VRISEAKKHYVDVPKKTNFHIPEGKYRAKIVGINDVLPEKSHVTGKTKKFVFEVEVPSLPKTRNLATAEYLEDLDDDTELHKVVSRLLGPKAIEDAAGEKLDIGELEGKDVDVEIGHITTNRSHEYDYPLVKVRDVYPAGTLVKPPVISQPEQNQPTKEGESMAKN
jgi:hypothetical protein